MSQDMAKLTKGLCSKCCRIALSAHEKNNVPDKVMFMLFCGENEARLCREYGSKKSVVKQRERATPDHSRLRLVMCKLSRARRAQAVGDLADIDGRREIVPEIPSQAKYVSLHVRAVNSEAKKTPCSRKLDLNLRDYSSERELGRRDYPAASWKRCVWCTWGGADRDGKDARVIKQ